MYTYNITGIGFYHEGLGKIYDEFDIINKDELIDSCADDDFKLEFDEMLSEMPEVIEIISLCHELGITLTSHYHGAAEYTPITAMYSQVKVKEVMSKADLEKITQDVDDFIAKVHCSDIYKKSKYRDKIDKSMGFCSIEVSS